MQTPLFAFYMVLGPWHNHSWRREGPTPASKKSVPICPFVHPSVHPSVPLLKQQRDMSDRGIERSVIFSNDNHCVITQ